MAASDNQLIDGVGLRDLVPTPWAVDAACAAADPARFFIDHGESGNEAKVICAGCPVRSDCLGHAIETKERFGIWGGLTTKQRRVEARRRKEEAA